jgi:2-dehydro-3-deoxyphosphogalactonate aldolase
MLPDIEKFLSQSPFVAILRGITPNDIIPCASAIVDAGWRIIEVPLNSPSPIDSIRLLDAHFGNDILCGGGTVLNVEQVNAVASAGGKLVVSPNTNTAVIKESLKLGILGMPGFVTPTEAFTAYDAGARYLKLFPADNFGSDYLKALRSVLPPDVRVVPVGGVTPESVADLKKAGAVGFGIGSNVYKPGMSPADIKVRAQAFMSAWKIA